MIRRHPEGRSFVVTGSKNLLAFILTFARLFHFMISVSKAIEIVKHNVVATGPETVPLGLAVGRVLARDIIADTDLPPFDRSQMDGFAVIADDTSKTPVELKIVGESAAGNGWHRTLKKG